VVLDAYESDLAWIKKGHDASFSVEAIPGERFEGKVDFVDPILNEKTRTVTVRINVKNPKKLLKPGMFVRAEVRSMVSRDQNGKASLLVPASAVLKTGKRAVVYVRKPGTDEPVFEGREIIAGPRIGDHYVVVSGLEENEQVVTKGNFKIDSAFQIMAKPSMMNPEGGVAMTGHEHHADHAPATSQTAQAETPETSEQEKAKPQMADASFFEELVPVFDTYFKAQAALADDDFALARLELADLDSVILAVDDGALEDHAKHQWTEFKDAIHDKAQHAHHWSDIKAARKAFEPISMNMLQIERTYGHLGEAPYYEVFCPMAFDNKGASWLQNHDTVDNPYFGSMMLRCGEVRETFSPKK
jgi:Cu(I)/Ag(I) efflux system membrane fusion protein